MAELFNRYGELCVHYPQTNHRRKFVKILILKKDKIKIVHEEWVQTPMRRLGKIGIKKLAKIF